MSTASHGKSNPHSDDESISPVSSKDSNSSDTIAPRKGEPQDTNSENRQGEAAKGDSASNSTDAISQLQQAEMRLLRKALLEPERKRLRELAEQIEEASVRADNVSEVLPDAIRAAAAEGRDLAGPLGPFMPDAVKDAIRKNPEDVAETLSPVIGPTIRVAIAQALRGMVQSMNQIIDSSFSVRGIKWRLEAMRTGRSFGEVVLLNTLDYRVEQVFLIHRETGLPLQHVTAENLVADDETMVAGMLTAIQDFVTDSFTSSETGELATLEFGEKLVWIELGPAATLAAVIRGNAPIEFRERMEEALEATHLRFGDELSDEPHNTGLFEPCRPDLEQLLVTQLAAPEEKTFVSKLTTWLVWAALLAGIAFLIYWGATASARRRRIKEARQLLAPPASVDIEYEVNKLVATGSASRRWLRRTKEILDNEKTRSDIDVSQVEDRDADVLRRVDALNDQPGIAINSVDVAADGSVRVSGMRDRLADQVDTESIAAETDREIAWRWKPFVSADPEITERRIKQSIKTPDGVNLKLHDATLIATGEATQRWIDAAMEQALSIPGVDQVNFSDVGDADADYKRAAEILHAEPGIVVVSNEPSGDGYKISGFRDRFSRKPVEILSDAQIDAKKIEMSWQPFVAADPELVLPRAKEILDPPITVHIDLENHELKVSGAASSLWLQSAQRKSVPAVSRIDFSNVKNNERIAYDRLTSQLDGLLLEMVPNEVEFRREEQLAETLASLKELERLATILGERLTIRVTSKARGGDEFKPLAQSRTERATKALSELNLSKVETLFASETSEDALPGIHLELVTE